MIINQIYGGLGNQMFQYAAGRAASLRLNETMALDISFFESSSLHQGFELFRVFNIDTPLAGFEEISRVLGWQGFKYMRRIVARPEFKRIRKCSFIIEPSFNYWPGMRLVPGDCYLSGYWQSEKYFSDCVSIIRKDFAFKEPLGSLNEELLKKITQKNSVSLHVRRGDYVAYANTSVYACCSIGYYKKAVDYIAAQVKDPVFFVFSDDPDWVKANLKFEYDHFYVSHNKGTESYNDMRLMSRCDHHIIANSSFSWWGAWLNPCIDKIVIAPEAWFVNGTDASDLCPEAWIKL
ncbi:alpha-1,2-fucosyltransferase [Pseudomonas sp. LMG 31766]|uniref:Alpha-1,2-fucosyltransferase n=1 Tax=Pseudomonas chaetocerotis TaxID=2758695 RepID=A0A931CYA0_9PSED|nr:alpha-1,2-fucosyltransferase [Pseudomonas chaetocerotis]MBZ9664915.1 alpha-1,2-fucosyltransferase [Pseudomonas chaetocerotis]